MANLKLHQALTANEQKEIKRANLDCLVNYVGRFILEDAHLFGLHGLIFRHGMPAKFPDGEWGFLLYGDVGVMAKPVPNVMDHRVTYRSPETSMHEIVFSGVSQYQTKITNYYGRDKMDLINPELQIARHLAAMSRSITNYYDYIVYSIFVGTQTKTEDWYIKDYLNTYIEPSDGTTNGYKFYQSEGFEEINLTRVINKQKVTEHKLKKALEDMNKALRNDTRKVEVDDTKDDSLKTDWIKNNVTPAGKKVLALLHKVEDEVQKILLHGRFEPKYKHKKESFEGYHPTVRASDMVVIMSKRDANVLVRESNLKEEHTGSIKMGSIEGVQVMQTTLLDSGEAFIMHRDLIQAWIMPQLARYWVDNYRNEETRDFTYEWGHTLDLVDIYSSMWFKLKA